MQTEALALGSDQTAILVKIRFLQGEEEREILLPPYGLAAAPLTQSFRFPSIEIAIELATQRLDDRAWRLTVRIANVSSTDGAAMGSVHTLLHIDGGEPLTTALLKLKLMDEDAEGPDEDQWDGYPAERARLLEHLAAVTSAVVLSADS